MSPFTHLLQSTPIPIPILPTAYPTPPPLTPTLNTDIFWEMDRWSVSISVARTIWYLQFLEYFLYFMMFVALVMIALRVFNMVVNHRQEIAKEQAEDRRESSPRRNEI